MDDHDLSGSGALREREKELDFIYELAALLSRPNLSARQAAEGMATLFSRAMGEPSRAFVSVSVGAETTSCPKNASAPATSASMESIAGDRTICRLAASYDDGQPPVKFSARERSLCASATTILAVAAERLEADERERAYRTSLENKNTVLSELLSRIELEKQSIRTSILERINERVLPLIARLARTVASRSPAAGADPAEGEAFRLEARIRRELDAALSRGDPGFADPRRRLSVRELEICDLVAAGLTSKQIAERLSIASATVERHRYNVRHKLGMPEREGSIASALGFATRDM